MIEYNEELDAIVSLELLSEQLPKSLIAPHHWKWVIISLHNALQGFIILSLRNTNFLNVLTSKSARAWTEAYDNDEIPDKPPYLDNFLKLDNIVDIFGLVFRFFHAVYGDAGIGKNCGFTKLSGSHACAALDIITISLDL